MPYNNFKYLVVVQPTSETKGSFLVGELELYGLNFNKKYIPDDLCTDKPSEPLPVQVKVIYAE